MFTLRQPGSVTGWGKLFWIAVPVSGGASPGLILQEALPWRRHAELVLPVVLLGEAEIGQAGGEASSGVRVQPTRGLIHTPATQCLETRRLQSHLSQRSLGTGCCLET